jgi:PilZ domain
VSRQLTALDGRAAEPLESAAVASPMTTVEPMARDEPAPAPHVPLGSGAVRQADRIKVFGSRAIKIDRATGVLVDLSRSGAQVLLPCAVRPHQALRVQLPGADQTMRCKGRVVWVRFEIAQAAGSYRAGIQFTEIDAAALEAFLGEYEAPAKESSRAG